MAKKKVSARQTARSGTPRQRATRTRPHDAAEDSADVQAAEEQLHAAREQLRKAEAMYEQARRKAAEEVDKIRAQTIGDVVDTTLEFVRQHPGLGLFSAAAIGFFVARLFRR